MWRVRWNRISNRLIERQKNSRHDRYKRGGVVVLLFKFKEWPQRCTTLLFIPTQDIGGKCVSDFGDCCVIAERNQTGGPLNRRLLGLRLGPACRPSFELLAPKVYNFLLQPTRRLFAKDSNEYGYRWKQEKEDRPRVFRR